MTLRRDTERALLLAEGLGACARIAVDEGVTERTYLSLAQRLYRELAGLPQRGRRAASHGDWDPLLRAAGGQGKLAEALGVARKTVVRWVSGATSPGGEDPDRLRALARKHRVASPI